MKKTKWANFAGSVLATATLGVVAASSNHVRKKYGQSKEHLFLSDLQYLGNYALDRFVFNNEKTLEWLDARLHFTEIF